MTKSKIFTGISAVVLAIAGFAATKASTVRVNYAYITTAGTVKTCHTADLATCSGGSKKCTFSIASQTATIYTVNALSPCSNIISLRP